MKILSSTEVQHIHSAWKRGNFEDVRQIWQMYLDQFRNMSFYEVLKTRTPINDHEKISIFGALGIGSGGFSPLFQVGFMEILRLLVNGYLDEQILIRDGISEFAKRLYQLKILTPFGSQSLADIQCLYLNLPVISMDYNANTGNPVITCKTITGKIEEKEYPAVVFTGSMCAAHLINLTSKTRSGAYLFKDDVRAAIRNSPMIASSKTFICTKNKFWIDKKMPQCILTDDLPRAIYFLNYPQTKHGVVCLSYTWGMDAMKLHAVDPNDRVVMFKRVIENISGNTNQYLEPLNREIITIDWINKKYQNGAFKLLAPGMGRGQQALYFQFQSAKSPEDKGVYISGDSISWSGGWVEGALYTGLNAVYAVATRLGAKLPSGTPMDQQYDLYNYG